jgi:hypothetical protein
MCGDRLTKNSVMLLGTDVKEGMKLRETEQRPDEVIFANRKKHNNTNPVEDSGIID